MADNDAVADRLDVGHESPESKNPLLRLLSELMSNKHRGYAGLRGGGGVHPVPGIGVETGGTGGERFDTALSTDDVVAALEDGVRGMLDHVLSVRANGPFNGFVLPAHQFQANQYTFEVYNGAGQPKAERIVGAHPLRLDVMLKAHTLTNGNIFVGNTENGCQPTSGYPLTSGEVITLPSRAEIWACSTSTTQATLATMSTMRDG